MENSTKLRQLHHLSAAVRRRNLQEFCRHQMMAGRRPAASVLILKMLMRNAACVSMFLTSATGIWLFTCRDAPRSGILSLFPLGGLSAATLHPLGPCDPAECVDTRLATPLSFYRKIRTPCLEYISSPIRRQLARKIDAAVGFWVICKSAVTVTGAAQRRWRRGKCQQEGVIENI